MGTITYGGNCSSSTTSATSGNNTIIFSTPGAGTYSDCTIKVTDSAGNISSALTVSTFVVEIWKQESYLKAVNNDAGDNFGYSVSISGDTLAVGVRLEDSNQTTITNGTSASSDDSNANSGAVYVYKRTGTSWAQEAYIKAANNDASDFFGSSVSISGDTLAVGAYREDSNQTTITNGTSASSDNSSSDSGAVYVYDQ